MMLSINLSLNLVQSTVSTLFKTVTIIRSAGAPLQVVCPSPSESDKQVEKILHRCLLKKQAILSEQGVLCFSYIYIRPTAEEYQYNIPPKNPVVQMLKNFFLHCSTFTKCFYSNKYHRFTYMLHVRFQVFSHSCM